MVFLKLKPSNMSAFEREFTVGSGTLISQTNMVFTTSNFYIYKHHYICTLTQYIFTIGFWFK